MDNVNLTDHFLIAMPTMSDPYFAKSLVYICEHNAQGAMGVVVNRPVEMTVGNLFEKIEMRLDSGDIAALPVYFGGPVQLDRGFVLHRPCGDWQSSLKVSDKLALTSSRDVLQAIGSEGQPSDILVTLGYSGWDAGQLEEEMAQNTWLSVAAEHDILFRLPFEERLPAALQKLGISFSQLSDVAGHA